ncbi:MAG TPA: transglutaminaseTgpA domain-containing protein [Trebonia sp.]|nr:transglutaminaseTgpA domain-containing protein [Trebonia sp.]
MTSHRRTAATAVAVILASVSLYPIFSGTAWFWAGCASVIVTALAGTLARLRRLPVAVVLLAYVAALLVWLNLAFSNARSLWHLLPTPASLAALFHIAGQGFNEAAKYAPPVPELRGMVLLAAAGIGITAALTDLIAVRLSSAALAGLPLLLLFTEPFTLSVSRGFLGTVIAFCAGVAGYLGLLSSEGRDRIREWEQAGPSARDEPDTGALAAAGRRVGFASVALALCLPLFIPGLHATRLFGGQPGIGGAGGGSGGGGVVGFPDPNTQLSDELHTAQPENVLSYTTTDNSEPGYLQIYVLDKLTSQSGWQMFAQPENLVRVGPSLPPAPGLTASGPSVAAETTTVSFAPSVGSDPLGALPAPYPATAVSANGTLRADKSTLMLFDSGISFDGLKYTVNSLDELPSFEALSAAPPPPASIGSHYLSVPSAYDSLKPLALSVTKAAGAKTELAGAIALQNWLSGGTFKYTLDAPTVLNAAGLTNFLKVTKAGYCQQFSFAMAVLARLLGIPSRVAYGFTPGLLQSAGDWLVTTHDAHAWPELYFQGYGWLRFEPTPGGVTTGQSTAFAPSYSYPLPSGAGTGQSQTLPLTGPATAPGSNAHQRLPSPLPASDQQLTAPGTVSPWAILGLVVAGLIACAAVAPWCARRLIRSRRWRHRGGPGPAGTDRAARVRARDVAWAHAAWEELRDDLTDYGAASLPSESPRAAAARAATGLGLAGAAQAALGRIAMAEERARYAPAPADGSGLRADSTAVRQAIAAAVPRRSRWRARLLPSSVVTPALNAVASTADLYRGSRKAFPWLRVNRG